MLDGKHWNKGNDPRPVADPSIGAASDGISITRISRR